MTARSHSYSSKAGAKDAFGSQTCFDCARHETFAESISHLMYDHNLFVRRELVRLERLLETLCEEPGDDAPPLADLGSAFAALKSMVMVLIEFEEETLYPLMLRLERAPFVAADSPESIGMMTAAKRQVDSYGHALSLLERLRSCAFSYEPPRDAHLLCTCVFYDLAVFDEELRKRVQLKDALFRRALVELPLRRPRKAPHRAARHHTAADVHPRM